MTMPPLASLFFTMMALHLLLGFQAYALVPYDYSYTLGCVPEAEGPQYGGGITVNPRFEHGLDGWVAVGNAEVAWARPLFGNGYAVVYNISEPRSDGVSQSFFLHRNNYYVVSAWIQAGGGQTVDVQAKAVTSTGNVTAGWITAKPGCWKMLKGGFTVNASEVAELRFDTKSRGVDIWIDNVSVQPFTGEEWALHQQHSVEKVRKGRVTVQVSDRFWRPVADAAITIKQLQPHFPFGNVMNGLIIGNQAYQRWFVEKGFRYTAFENELKWQLTEKNPGMEDYTNPDAMLAFCRANNVTVRGHNILWDDPKYQPEWVLNLTDGERRTAAINRVNSVVNRYRGQFIHWDVINENLHETYISNVTDNGIYNLVHRLDPRPIPFLNEYNVVEACSFDGEASPQKYLQKIDQLREEGYDGPLGIGLESHFDKVAPTVPYVRATVDIFAATGLPIWITELTVNSTFPNLTQYLELLLRELHSHPAVDGILLWSAVNANDTCYSMCLTDSQYKNLPAGDTVDEFVGELIHVGDTVGTTGFDGGFEASLFYGEYEAIVTCPNGAKGSFLFKLMPGDGDGVAIHFKI